MALTSPGVQVSVIDESFYTPAEPGTRPLFIVATAENKSNGAGTGTAQGTLAANAGKVYTITSQRDLVETFGDPVFKVDSNNNPIHAGEQNEYGLQAAYSFLGVSNSALVVRANLDLGTLDASADAPGGKPKNGTFWLDTGTTQFGIFQWNGAAASVSGGQSFTSITPAIVLTGAPTASFGAIGNYAIASGSDTTGTDNIPDADDRNSHELSLYYKNRSNTWVLVGSGDWKKSWPTAKSNAFGGTTSGTFTFTNGTVTSPTITWNGSLAGLANSINDANVSGITAEVVSGQLEIYSTGAALTLTVLTGTVLADIGLIVSGTSKTFYAPALSMQPHTQIPEFKLRDDNPRPTGSIWIKTTEPNAGARWRLKIYNENTELWAPVEAPLYSSNQDALAGLDPTAGGASLPVNTAFVDFNLSDSVNPLATFRVMRRTKAGATVIKTKPFESGTIPTNSGNSFQLSESVSGSSTLVTKLITFSSNGTSADANSLAAAINGAGFTNITASVETATNRVAISHKTGGEMRFGDLGDSTYTVGLLGIYGLGTGTGGNTNVYLAPSNDSTHRYIASNWIPLTITPDTATVIQQSYYIQNDAPTTLVDDGKLWYNSIVDEVDIMIHNGATWVGYLNYDHNPDSALTTDPNGPIVSASQPSTQSDGSTALQEGDLWIDTSDIENYPVIKRYDGTNQKWITLDKTDQTSENGVLFADARWADAGDKSAPSSIQDLLESNYLDFDAPDPALYPKGMLLWNLRRSGFNVKKFVQNYIDTTDDNKRYKASQSDLGQRPTSGDSMAAYYPHRWVTESGNQADGSGSFGRKAQRKVVIQALQALANSNEEIRDTERNGFNLLACPGYSELIGELVSLNYDRGLTSFVVGDTPARLRPDATTINNWGTNLAGALQDDDNGLVTSDEYLGVFYPWGFTSDNAGRDIAVPPSHMILRMIALSDQVSYPWFAPAGTRRGGITNASAVGYISDEGEFISVALNEGQRDTLYNVKVNPITFFVGAGLVNFGQKTRARNASALDRINVARLVIYLRSQLNRLAKPYIFEPNDKITRDEIKQQVESLLLELVGQRALYDFLVVCDESNNTPNRIDRNELYVDIAIEPVKAVEFIYIPVRLKNTGEIAGLG